MKLNSFLQIKHHRQEVEIYNTQSLEKTSLIFPKGEDEVISIGKEIFLPVGEDEYKKFKVVDLYIEFKKRNKLANHFINYEMDENEPDSGYEFNTVIQVFVDDLSL